jgi:hypothetical protein
VSPTAVRRRHIEAYVGTFGVGRAATTVNHRLGVLASCSAFLIRRDTEVGEGAWPAGRARCLRGSWRGALRDSPIQIRFRRSRTPGAGRLAQNPPEPVG